MNILHCDANEMGFSSDYVKFYVEQAWSEFDRKH